MIALALAFLLAASPKAFDLHPGKAHDEHAVAWLLEDPRKGAWCAFTSRKALKAKGDELSRTEPDERPVYAWVEASNGVLTAVTMEFLSEDAFTSDRYTFDASGRLVSLARTGHYIKDPVVSFYFYPGKDGRLAQPARGKAMARKYESYWLDWSRYDSLSQMPFSRLIARREGKVVVNFGCAPTVGEKNRAH